jgi:hypothetical protein
MSFYLRGFGGLQKKLQFYGLNLKQMIKLFFGRWKKWISL